MTKPDKNEQPDNHGWRPIETAPRNGTLILLCSAGYQPCAGMWFDKPEFDHGKCWLPFAPEGVFECDQDLDDYMGNGFYNPTHWQPLPPPPEDEST